MSFNPLYNEYTPTKIVIDNLGINISAEKNDTLALASEYLVVGERFDKTVSMIVDSRGLCINKRSATDNNLRDHDNEIHGNTLLKGNIYVDGTIFGSINGNSPDITAFGDIFKYSYDGVGIYYDGRTTFGSSNSSSNNPYIVNISKSIQRNIDNAHFAIQNEHDAVAKMAILGESKFSPVVFNTSSNVPIEFHVGRDKDFFINSYKKIAFEPGPKLVNSDIPAYLGKLSSPHLNIDINGNVGIKTDFNQLFRYNIRTIDGGGVAQYENQVFHPDLFVNGTTFSSNILMFDYETDSHKNLDEIYARRNGQSVVLSNLAPGKFARGFFQFQSNISIMGDIDLSSALMVYGDTSNTGNINVDENVTVEKTLTARNANVEETATFHNNVYIQDNIFIKANIYKYVDTRENEDIYEMLSINNNVITLENGAESDFFYYRSGYATKGRLGIGIDASKRDEVNNQVVVRKRDRTIFELELTDNTFGGFSKTAFIGHPNTTYDTRNDGSLVFVTPSRDNEVYQSSWANAKQNIYFYPGHEEPLSTFTIKDDSPPTFGMFVNKKVGIKTFNPEYDFDVNGDIAVTGNYYVKRENNTNIKLGIWAENTFGTDNPYSGIYYYNEESPHVGINTIPQKEYGLTVVGKVLSMQGYYTIDGLKTIPFYNAYDASLKPTQEYEYAFLQGRMGIGDLETLATLSVCETNPGHSTSVKILNSSFGESSTLHFVGNANEYIQEMNDTNGTFEIFNTADTSLTRALITKFYENGSNQMILNSNLNYGLEKRDAALLVNGNVEVNGDMNITGNYRISSRAIEITAGEPAEFYKVPSTDENVYITGDSIQLNTNTNNRGALYIGWGNDVANSGRNALMNVALRTTGNTQLIYVSKFTSYASSSVLTQYESKSGGGYSSIIGISENRFFIGANTTIPYIVIIPSMNNSMGIGTDKPNGSRLHVYTDVNTRPVATFTRYNNTSDKDSIFSDISLEKIVNENRYQWSLHAPVFSGNNQKFQFLYKDNVNIGYSQLKEKVCITKDGFIGINTPNPQYALDIYGTDFGGSIRMRQSTIQDKRQNLIFQSGDSTYGSDLLTDYSIYAFSNTFCIESADTFKGSKTLFHVGSNNNIGLNRIANDDYTVSIDGTLDVSEAISINGRPFFSVLDNNDENGSFLEWKNIFLNPQPVAYGGININATLSSSNLFQINSGLDGNLLVLNSGYEQSLMHFRNFHLHQGVEDFERIWRSGSSNNSFILEYRSNVIYRETLITDSPEHYVRIAEYIETENSGEFIQHLNGSIALDILNPSITMNENNTIGLSNENIYITTNNLGIGTIEPVAKFDIENNDDVESFKISHNNSTSNIVTINKDDFVITHNGYVGIGTALPDSTMHVIGKTTFENTDTSIEVIGNSIFQNNITIKGNIVNDSDSRIKSDVKVIEDALSKIKKISGYTFIKNERMPRETGVIAQEIREVLPEAVFEHGDGLLGVAYGNMIGLLIEGIKELSDKLDDIYLRI